MYWGIINDIYLVETKHTFDLFVPKEVLGHGIRAFYVSKTQYVHSWGNIMIRLGYLTTHVLLKNL